MARIAFLSERMLLGFGVDLEIHCVASELVARGHDVTVHAVRADESLERPYRLETFPFRQSSILPLQDRAARAWAGFLDASEYDLICVLTFPFFSLLPRLVTPTLAVDNGVSPSSRSLRERLNFSYVALSQQRRFFPHAGRLFTISEYVRSLLPQGVSQRARVVYLGADHLRRGTQSDRRDMRESLGLADDDVMLLYVGRLNPEAQPYKGTLDLMAAASEWRVRAPHLKIVMAGKGSGADESRISDAGAIPMLKAPPSAMPALFAAADVYLTATRWEGFDLPLMEAAHQGVPAAALGIGPHPEVARNGETAILAPDVPGLLAAAERLADDPGLRESMGQAAQRFAGQFTWSKTTDAYEDVLETIGRAGGASPPEPRASRDVTVIILNYGAPLRVLRGCVASAVSQTHPVDVLVVDNASPRNTEVLDEVTAEFPDVRVLKLPNNQGFAGGMNRGIEAATSPYVVLLNNDTVLEPGAVAEMRRVIDLDLEAVGVAPKTVFESAPHVIDSMGNLIDQWGAAFNMGIGQIDIGQYDRVEKTFGACFAATLIRRSAFEKGMVGSLDERFFMYYEDVDWCLRAGLLGFTFLTAPRAVVYHAHSFSTKEQTYDFKYRLIMRNLLRTVIRNFSWSRAARVALGRSRAIFINALRGPYRRACLRILWDTLVWLPVYIAARRPVQRRRRRADHEIFNFSHGEKPYFDAVEYRPELDVEVLEAMYRRLYLLSGEPRHKEIADVAGALSGRRFRFEGQMVSDRLEELVQAEPPAVKDFVTELGLRSPRRR